MRDRLRGGRVVTLTGPGGCGKTWLALRVAALAEAGFGDGARLVELAPLTDPALVPASVAQALGVSDRDAPTQAAGLVRELADRDLLVVLDNCKHVQEAAAGLVATLVAQCRRLRCLATSREHLDVPGELVVPVPPLGLPADGSAAVAVRGTSPLWRTGRGLGSRRPAAAGRAARWPARRTPARTNSARARRPAAPRCLATTPPRWSHRHYRQARALQKDECYPCVASASRGRAAQLSASAGNGASPRSVQPAGSASTEHGPQQPPRRVGVTARLGTARELVEDQYITFCNQPTDPQPAVRQY